MSESIVVICAHAFEAKAMAAVGRGITRQRWGQWSLYAGELWDLPLQIVRCGPGKAAAAAATQAAVGFLDPALVICFGAAGTFDVSIKLGTMIVAKWVVDVDLANASDMPVELPSLFTPDSELVEQLLKVPGTKPGGLLCWEGRVASPANRPKWEGEERYVAVDWESAGVATVCRSWGIPWAALKVVSDHGEPERLRMMAAIAKRPLHWAAEVIRRACYAYMTEKVRTQEVAETAES